MSTRNKLKRIKKFRSWFAFAVGAAIIVIGLKILVGVGASTIQAGKWAGGKMVETVDQIGHSWKNIKQERKWKQAIKNNNQWVEQGCETGNWFRNTLGGSTEAECRAMAYRDLRYKLWEECEKYNQHQRHAAQRLRLGNRYSVHYENCIPKNRLDLTTPLTRDDYPFMNGNW